MKSTLTTCCFCACGCGFYLQSDGQRIIGVTPSRAHPISRGNLCIKGWNCAEHVHHAERLQEPLIRKNGKLVRTTWDKALGRVSKELLRAKKRAGSESIGIISSAKCTNEENYLLMKLARAVLKTNNVDHCARLCHSSSVLGLTNAFGSGAMTNSISELGEAEVILVTGSNTTQQHPQIARFILKAVDKGARLIVIDPRGIELGRFAHLYLRPRPATDVLWLNGMMKIILEEGLIDDSFIKMRTENFAAFRNFLMQFELGRVEEISGIPLDGLRQAARIYAAAKRAAVIYSMGITQHVSGTDNVQSIANLAMLTGHVEQEFTGVFPLRGQNNVQGACDMGALPGTLTGYQRVDDPAIRDKFARAWNTDLPTSPGLTSMDMFHGPSPIRAMYIMGENPMLSHPDLNSVKASLENLDFLAVADIFLTETAQLADVVLPAAAFAERDGTVTSTERRIQRIRKAVSPSYAAKPDWQIICDLAHHMDYPMVYESPAEIMEEIALLTPIYGGVYYDRLETINGLQWPCPSRSHPGTPYLHKRSFTRGKGLFACIEYRPPAELPDNVYPFILSTGRVYEHWHTGTVTRKTSTLHRERPEGFVEINPGDARELAIGNGELIRIISRRGEISVKALLVDDLPPKTVFMPFHYRESPANLLTNSAVDPQARIPELKVCAVRLEKAGL
ncbi:MAG: formate dehydrogenase subunit alpha [Pseudomonadota bacterium]